MLAHALLAFLSLQLPQNDTIPQAHCHTEVDHRVVFCDGFFFHGLSDLCSCDNDQLENQIYFKEEMIIVFIKVRAFKN